MEVGVKRTTIARIAAGSRESVRSDGLADLGDEERSDIGGPRMGYWGDSACVGCLIRAGRWNDFFREIAYGWP